MDNGIKPSDEAKKPYLKPELMIHGDVADLTRFNVCFVGSPDSGTQEYDYVSGAICYTEK